MVLNLLFNSYENVSVSSYEALVCVASKKIMTGQIVVNIFIYFFYGMSKEG